MRFVIAFGMVSMFADMVYEGARAITGPYLATFGASAAIVGLVTGIGEAAALVLRLPSGKVADRTGRLWALSIAGYAMTVSAVPLLALAHVFWQAAGLIVAERFGKAVRTPARDSMLAAASVRFGRGTTFAIHEAMDQSGALIGPLIVAAMIALAGYRAGFAALAVPGALALAVLAWLRLSVPHPLAYEAESPARATVETDDREPLPERFWSYLAFTCLAMLGFSTFAVPAYHMHVAGLLADDMIPVAYAAAMASAGIAALITGRLYDRIGLWSLTSALVLAIVAAMLIFSTDPAHVWIGAVVWGATAGIHESTMRAAVADIVPRSRRGEGYGIFAAGYGLAWMAGSTLIGLLYPVSLTGLVGFVAVTQLAALLVLLRMVSHRWDKEVQ
ncbi:MAG: MFS transporter [Bosea sp. (in: a-proteobacteria)]|uniref:MFS transporter n=1 Tax=Bosea sp. (in: a-proteobacteria) TaxID=1871050 RepID=UPI003F7CABC7